jgi:hypothetical protein
MKSGFDFKPRIARGVYKVPNSGPNRPHSQR